MKLNPSSFSSIPSSLPHHKQKSLLLKLSNLLIVGSLCITLSNAAVNIMGVEFPNVEHMEVKRGPGMPYLHSNPKVLLGNFRF